MDEEVKELVRRLLKEGQRYDDVRRAIISNGHSTAGFEDEYNDIQSELGIVEPKPEPVALPKINPVMDAEVKDRADEYEQKRRALMLTNVARLIVGLLVIAAAGIIFSRYGETIREKVMGNMLTNTVDGLGAADIKIETDLRRFQLSAERYKSTLLDYGGLCESIGINKDAYSCIDDVETYTIEAILSNDQYFCVDNTGYAGIVPESRGGKGTCE